MSVNVSGCEQQVNYCNVPLAQYIKPDCYPSNEIRYLSHILIKEKYKFMTYGRDIFRKPKVWYNWVNNILIRNVFFYLFQINTKELFWDWAITSLVPSLYPSRVSHEYPYVGIMTSGKSSNVLGIGRIRQLRITKGKDLSH